MRFQRAEHVGDQGPACALLGILLRVEIIELVVVIKLELLAAGEWYCLKVASLDCEINRR